MAKFTQIVLAFLIATNLILSVNSLSDYEQAAAIVNCINGNQLSCSLAFQSFSNITTIVFNSVITNTTQLNPNSIPAQLIDPSYFNMIFGQTVNSIMSAINNWFEGIGSFLIGLVNQFNTQIVNNTNPISLNDPTPLISLVSNILGSNNNNQINQNLLNNIINAGLSNLPNGILNSISNGQNNGPAIMSLLNSINYLNNLPNSLNNQNVVNTIVQNITNILNNSAVNLNDLNSLLNGLNLKNNTLETFTKVMPVFSNVLSQFRQENIEKTVKDTINQLANNPQTLKEIKGGLFNLFNNNKGKK